MILAALVIHVRSVMAANTTKQIVRKNNRSKRGRGKKSGHYFLASYAYTHYSDFSQVSGETQNHLRVTRSRKNINSMSMFAPPMSQTVSKGRVKETSSPAPLPDGPESVSQQAQLDLNSVSISEEPSGDLHRDPKQRKVSAQTAPLSPIAEAKESLTTEATRSEGAHSEGVVTSKQNQDLVSEILPATQPLTTEIAIYDCHSEGGGNQPPIAPTELDGIQVQDISTPHRQNQLKPSGDFDTNSHNGAKDDIIMQTLNSMNSRLQKLDTLESMSAEMKEDIGKVHSRITSISNQVAGIQTDLRKAEDKWEESEGALKDRMSRVENGCHKIEKDWERCKTALHTDLNVVQSSVKKNSSQLQQIEHQLSEYNPNGVSADEIQEKIDLAVEKKFQELQSTFKEDLRQDIKGEVASNQKTQDENQAYEKLKDQAYRNRFNLLVFGIPESSSAEQDRVAVLDFFSSKMGVSKPNLSALYRLGRHGNGRHRPIVVKFVDINERWDIWKKRGTIKHDPENPVWIQEDLPKKLREDNRVLLRILKTAKSMSRSTYDIKIQDFQIVLNGERYDMNNLFRLPREISTKMAFTPYSDKVVVFFTKYSPLSNHFPCTFVVDTVTFHCVEQYLAVQRAFMAKNKSLTRRVMGTKNPADHKNVLNILRNDQPEVWREKAETLIISALRAKFLQNKDLAHFLMDTYPRLIGEASKNEVWGIGLTLDNRDVLDNSKWKKGGNLLGRSLVKVREELIANKEHSSKMCSNITPKHQGHKQVKQ